MLAVPLMAVPAPAQAAPPPIWSITEVTSSSYVGTNGATLQVSCPAGQTPLSGGYRSTTTTDIRRLGEQYGYGSGAKYMVDLVTDSGTHQVTVNLLCAPVSYFSGDHLVAQGFTTGSNYIAAGTLGCPSGEKALNVSVTFNSTATTVLTTFPNSGLGSWFVRGYAEPQGATMTLFTRCVSGAGLGSIRMATASPAVGWGTNVVAPCPGGMQPITGGTYHSGGDGGAITVQGRPTSSLAYLQVNNHTHYWTEGAWNSVALSTSGGYMISNVFCVPSSDPFIEGSSGPSPDPRSTTARWDFQVVDPAAAGGFTTTVWCAYAEPGQQQPEIINPCTSPFERHGLADGSYNMTIHADTSDGRWSLSNVGSVVIDTTAPTANLGSNLYDTSDLVLALTVNDRSNVEVLECGLDGASPTACGDGYVPPYCDPEFGCTVGYYDYRGVQPLPQQGLSDGAHTLTAHLVDDRGNEITYERAFQVDTIAPTVTQTGPAQRFTVATKATATWTGNDAVSGIASYGVRSRQAAYNAAFGAWSAPVAATASATSRSFGGLVRGSTYCFSVDAVDKAGNTSAWTPEKCTAIPLDDRDLARSSGWTALKPAGYFFGTALSAKRFGSTLSATGVTLKRVAVVAKKCSTCGVVGVYVAGKLIAKVNLRAATVSRAVIALPAFEQRSGTVTLKVLSSGKLVQIDGLGVSVR